jgi:CRISPR-associated protein (TIGR03984 family)
MAWLLHRARDSVTLDDALADIAPILGSPAVCLLYLPYECIVARLLPGGALEHDGVALTGDGAFEARVFSPGGELRWVHEADERGRAVTLTEEGGAELSRLGAGWAATQRIGPAEPEDVRYVLWGMAGAEGRAAGWTRMRSPRTGDLLVPLDFPGGGRPVYLHGREYLGRVTAVRSAARDDGNVVVLEELLRVVSADEESR